MPIYGSVVNSVTHAPIARALVTYGNEFAALTDNDGHFQFSLPASDARSTLRVEARKPGFFDVANGSGEIEASSGAELIILLVPEAIIKGRVLLSSNDPASRATVQLYSRNTENGLFRWRPREIVQANSNGEFRFAELQAGSYKVLTHEFMDNDPIDSKPGGPMFGYPPLYFPNATDFPSGSVIQILAGETFQADLVLVRRAYYPVQIPIENPDLAGGLAINVLPQGHRSPGYSLGYNFAKHRIEGQLPDGKYEVEAFAYTQKGVTGMTDLTVAGGAAENSSMALQPNGSITLNVREEFTSDNQPRTGSWSDGTRTFTFTGPRTYLSPDVEPVDDFEQRSWSLHPPAQDNDSLVIENLSSGRYWLRLDADVGYVASATMGGIDLLHHPFTFEGGSSTSIDITMRDDFAEIEGSVSGAVGTPSAPGAAYGTIGSGQSFSKFIAGSPAYIYCIPLPDSSGQFQQLGVDSEGKFHSQTIPPGTYRILAFKQPQSTLPYRDAEGMKAYDSKGQVVHLSSGQKTSVELQLITEVD